jgi:hypothetical protein
MAARTNNTQVLANIRELEKNAVQAVQSIEVGYADASKAILAFTIGCRGQTPTIFESGLIRISEAAPGVAVVTIRAYCSNARRIFAASQEAYDTAAKTAGTESIKALASACPALAKKKSEEAKQREAAAREAKRKEAEQKRLAELSGVVTVTTPDSDPLLALANDLVRVRKLAAGKAKSRVILAVVSEIEDMLETVREMLAA